MKRIFLLTCMLPIAFSGSATATKAKDPIHVLATRMDVFYFKVEKEFLGAEIEIYAADGKQLASQKVAHRRVLIDFYFETPGNYIIRLNKNDVQREYKFFKENVCPEPGITATVTIAQGV